MMPTLYDSYKDPGPWDESLPADLLTSFKYLRNTFETNHWEYGQVTEKLCYWKLHPETPDQEISAYFEPLSLMKTVAGTSSTKRFVDLLKVETAPATFKAFFDLYVDCISRPALAIFHELVAVGKANEQRLGTYHLSWAEAQTKNMIRSNLHLIRIWVPNVGINEPTVPKKT